MNVKIIKVNIIKRSIAFSFETHEFPVSLSPKFYFISQSNQCSLKQSQHAGEDFQLYILLHSLGRTIKYSFLILIIRKMSYCDNKNNSWSQVFPRIHFIIYEDKVALRVNQNIADSVRHQKRNFSFALTCQKKMFCARQHRIVLSVSSNFFLIFIVKKFRCYNDDIDFPRT